jgi:hypothetical protein
VDKLFDDVFLMKRDTLWVNKTEQTFRQSHIGAVRQVRKRLRYNKQRMTIKKHGRNTGKNKVNRGVLSQ